MASGSLAALLVAYLLGGVTFIPLIVIFAFLYGYFTFPHRSDVGVAGQDGDGDILMPGHDKTSLDAVVAGVKTELKTRPSEDVDAASGYFAVYREYNPAGMNAKPVERPVPVASTTIAAPSPSVYQTMYRSIFDRKPSAGPLDNNTRVGQRPKKAGNVFYVVLRHGHLMLFDDEEQLEVRHVISLAHHDISIYSGEAIIPEGELFIKRNAIRLSRRIDGTSPPQPDGAMSKPFFVFSENCSAKEDFYFALLKNQQEAFGYDDPGPVPRQFELKSMISLVEKLHSSEDQVHSRWLNALIGRLFLGIYKTSDLSNLITEKITKKIARVKRPSFLTNIAIQKIQTGDSAPYFSGMRLRDLTIEGECVIEADLKYNGNFGIEVAATAKIDLGTRFKTREVNMVLAVVLKRLEGHILFKIKAPPSNRIWFSFQTMPKLEMVIEPIVSSKQITYTVITRQIENRIKEVFAETLVQPFWDDVPFSKTEHKKWRGGIFQNDDVAEPSIAMDEMAAPIGAGEVAEPLDVKQDVDDLPTLSKSQSQPTLESLRPVSSSLFGRRSAKVGANPAAAASSTSVETIPSQPPPSASPSRSPAILKSSTEPIVGTETAHADIFKPSTSPPDQASDYMTALHNRGQDVPPRPPSPQLPLRRPSLSHSPGRTPSSSSKEAMNGHGTEDAEPSSTRHISQPNTQPAIQPVDHPTIQPTTQSATQPTTHQTAQSTTPPTTQPTPQSTSQSANHNISQPTAQPPLGRTRTSSVESATHEDNMPPMTGAGSPSSTLKHQAASLGRNMFKREGSNASTAAASCESESQTHKKNNTVAALTNAAAQARQWGWNALQRQRDAMRNGDKSSAFDLTQPMGRGQPLPPPGMPLPGPSNGRTKMMAIPTGRQQGLGSQTELGMDTVAEGEESDNHGRLTASQPFSQPFAHRRRGESQHKQSQQQQQNHDASEEPNMLIVAAPDDSQPGTPEAEEDSDRSMLWPNRNISAKDSPEIKPPKLRGPSSVPDAREFGSPRAGSVRSVSFPAIALADDDLSGWMSEDDDEPDDSASGVKE